MKSQWIKFSILITLLIGFQIWSAYQQGMPNFSPIAAFIFCGFASLNWRLASLTFIAWFLAFPLMTKLNGDYQILAWDSLIPLIGLLATAGVGFLFQKKFQNTSTPQLLIGSLVSAFAFYFITNGLCWLGSSFYTKDWTRLVEDMWTGPKGAAMPTWAFFKNALKANLLFTLIFAYSSIPVQKWVEAKAA